MLVLDQVGQEATILVELVDSIKPKKTLEVGCNWGKELKLLEGKTKIYGIDLNPEKIEKAKLYIKNGTFKQAFANALPFENNTFDLVYTDGCMSHNKDGLNGIIDEMLRVSKDYVLNIEYLTSKINLNSYANVKNNAWEHDYEKLWATKDVIVCFNRKILFGTDVFHVILVKKIRRTIKEVFWDVRMLEKSHFFELKIGKFKVGFGKW